MTKLPLGSLFRIILDKKSALRFLLGTIFSLSFSVAVILSTVGLMNGYSLKLKSALSTSNGDIIMKARSGFYSMDEIDNKLSNESEIKSTTHILKIEAFALANGKSKGVLVKGVEPKGFAQVSGLELSDLDQGVFIGKEFAREFQMKKGDSIVLAFNSKKAREMGSAILKEFTVAGIVEHGIFEKDMRFMYLNRDTLQQTLDLRSFTANEGLIKLKNSNSLEMVENRISVTYGDDYIFNTYWAEHQVLLDAVEIERNTISLALQLIVLVAVINVIAFKMYISEIKARDIFMLRALGLSMMNFTRFWYCMLALIWLVSVVLAFGQVLILDNLILKLPIFQLPGDIYKLSQLNILLKIDDYLMVYGLSLVWVLIVGFFTIKKIGGKSLLSGLREEFS
ncbi:MAG: hypothetical protein CME65_03945 [Halobacteriovoraceae bacterium]|nr:hypothetical protein [Halobacteriovoraceae bacterium]|tara:strand:+ start:10840 stop:12024 length:1185 start_codon:yes stop_codon:yes gene_type:complete